jgi:heat shock protein HslJ
MKSSTLAVVALAGLLISCAENHPQHAAQVPTPPPQTAIAAMAYILPPEAIGATWQWVSFTTPVENIAADSPERYTIEFQIDGHVAVQADCNHGFGTYTVKADSQIGFGPIALTRMMCPEGSQSDRFIHELGRVNSYFMKDGDFFLELPMDSGTFRFRKKTP